MSEALHLTLAYAAVSSVVAAIQEWRDLRGAQVTHTSHQYTYQFCPVDGIQYSLSMWTNLKSKVRSTQAHLFCDS